MSLLSSGHVNYVRLFVKYAPYAGCKCLSKGSSSTFGQIASDLQCLQVQNLGHKLAIIRGPLVSLRILIYTLVKLSCVYIPTLDLFKDTRCV